MTATQELVGSEPDLAIELISRRFADTFETLEVRYDLFSADVFFDLNMPIWRFQLQGREPFPEQPNNEFPFVLNTGRTVEHWHTRTKTSKVPILERLSPSAWVEMNPADARALRLKPQARVDIVSRRGRVQSRAQLLEIVWESAPDIQTRTVDMHVQRLRAKLGASGEMIETVRGFGYRLRRSSNTDR